MAGKWTWEGPAALMVGATRYELVPQEDAKAWASALLDLCGAITALEGRQLLNDELDAAVRISGSLRDGYRRLGRLAHQMESMFTPAGIVKALGGEDLGALARELAERLA